jgi:hypothetical protein
MTSLKQLKSADKSVARQRQLILDLNATARDIERCEKIIADLQRELYAVNSKYQGPRNTPQDIAFLSALLECAKKKLVWEKKIASLQKRTPPILQAMSAVLNDPQNPPAEQTRVEMLQALQKIQAAMERLQGVKAENEGTAPPAP